jgi:hypothetical protein
MMQVHPKIADKFQLRHIHEPTSRVITARPSHPGAAARNAPPPVPQGSAADLVPPRSSLPRPLELWRAAGPGTAALGLAPLGQASALIPALCSSVVDFPDPAHRAASQRKLDRWCQTLRRPADLL